MCSGRPRRATCPCPDGTPAACYSSCVAKAPSVFSFPEDSPFGAARATGDPSAAPPYKVSLAVGQCPRECIAYVTPLQLERLAAELDRVRDGSASAVEADFALFSLLAKANFENGRWQDPALKTKRTPRSTSKYVDWF